MTATLVAVQPVLLALVLAASGRVKLISRTARRQAAGTALGRLIGVSAAPVAYAALGVLELAVAAALLVGAAGAWLRPTAAIAAITVSAGFLGYLSYLRRWAPDSSCGCLGARQSPVGWRSFARAGVLLAAAVAALVAPIGWPAAIVDRPGMGVPVLVAELVAVVLLSAELDHGWLLPLRRLRARLRPHALTGAAHDAPLANTLQQLHRSPAYRQAGGRLRSDVLESWDEGTWRIVCYRAAGDDGPATAVFAVPRLRYEPEAVRVALVAEPRPDPAPAMG